MQQQLTVAVRIRPVFANEEEPQRRRGGAIATKVDDKMVLLRDPTAGDPVDVLRAKRATDRQYLFDWAFDASASQKEVYDKTTKSLVEKVIEGFNGTVFAYGATGSGKTHTMSGSDSDPGLMARALLHLFEAVERDPGCEVHLSYLEIYNEIIRDLLSTSPTPLELREDSRGNHLVVGLSQVRVHTVQEVTSLVSTGQRRRAQEATGANARSSRSHALMVVRVRSGTREGRLYFVDLAGSERAANTQNRGKRLAEGAHINKSLLALGNCINALAERHVRYVNFRDSKLTRLLKEPLTGNCRTVMVAHLSPTPAHFEETRNTLLYADRAKNISTKVRSNVSDVSFHVAQYQTVIGELRQEIESLRKRIRESDPPEDGDRPSPERTKELREKLVQSFNAQMEARRRLMEIDNTLLGQSIEFDKLGTLLGQWKTEKALSAMDNVDEDVSTPDVSTEGGEEDEGAMPDHVRQAWEELQYLRTQHQRYASMRSECERDVARCRDRTRALLSEASLHQDRGSEQAELLTLLARVHELEVEKLELGASQLVREHELRCRDLTIRRYDRQRQLCDHIITRQRSLIDAMASGRTEKSAEEARRELSELYLLYTTELSSEPRDDCSRQQQTATRSLGSSPGGSMLELHDLERMRHALPPIGTRSSTDQPESVENRVLFRRRRPPPLKGGQPLSPQALPPLTGDSFTPDSNNNHNDDRNSIGSSAWHRSPDSELFFDSSSSSPSDRRSSSLLSSGRDSDNNWRGSAPRRFGLLPSIPRGGKGAASSDSELLHLRKGQTGVRRNSRRGRTDPWRKTKPEGGGPRHPAIGYSFG